MLALVVNSNAGGKVARSYFAAKDFFAENRIQHKLVSADNPIQAKVELAEIEPTMIVAIGGDGTLHSLTELGIEKQIPITLLPSGSGNDSARKIGLVGRKPEDILQSSLLEENSRQIDVMQVQVSQGTFFSTGTISAGLDSKVNQRTNNYRFGGFLKYPIGLLRELPIFEAVSYEIAHGQESRIFEGMLCSVTNSGIFGGGMKIVPDASLEDGKLELFTVAKISKPELLKVFPRVYQGTHLSHQAVEVSSTNKISISAPVPVFADGEPLGFGGFTVEVLPKALRVGI